MKNFPSPKLMIAHTRLFEALYGLCRESRAAGIPPDAMLASCITSFMAIITDGVVSDNPDQRQNRRNLIVSAVNQALTAMDSLDYNAVCRKLPKEI